jgi:outer membrane lipoprotein-sorting protein
MNTITIRISRLTAVLTLVFGLLFTLFASTNAAAGVPDFQKMLAEQDAKMNFDDVDFTSTVIFTQKDPEKATTNLKVTIFRRDRQDKFLLLILEPVVQKGQGNLRVDDNLWFYDPESRKFTHTSMKESFAGTDTKNSDFGRSTVAKDYTVASFTEGKLGKYDCWILDLDGKNNEVTYPFLKLWIAKESQLRLKQQGYSLTKRLMRSSYYISWSKIGTKVFPSHQLFVDEITKGKQTESQLSNMSTDTLPEEVFTKAYLERVNN